MQEALRSASRWLEHEGDPVASTAPLSGGCICDAWLLETGSRRRFVLKTHRDAPARMFEAEARGLAAMGACGSLRIPDVLHWSEHFLLLEYIEPGSADGRTWQRLGQGLAVMHAEPAPCFGFPLDNYCGATPQPNPRGDDGHVFFAQHRLLYQGRLASERGLLGGKDLSRIESLCGRLSQLVPDQGPSLLHGDLWSGNLMIDRNAAPVLIDPACYWGWPEAEIGMTRLFGGFPEPFYDAWQESAQPEAGWRQRLPLYNLYHLLNHLNLFGRGYLGQVREVLTRFT